ncbi:MAG TPA: dTDP-4-dehydrorhamnose 3,5-epimerase [Terracidiphilus sp.]|nr:dTDP-4-dehydrorhamnose 3,5-epimerase [Terracidiphilus sp.]
MKINETSLPGVFLLTPTIHRDDRGAFWETWNRAGMKEAGLPTEWVQDNFSLSSLHVVRGIHYQVERPQAKLVRATRGVLLDVAVDLRRSSPHFGRHTAVQLTAENGEMLYIPVGFGHAFLALSEAVGLSYKLTDYYYPAGERTIIWNDSSLAIPWPIAADQAILSEKDRKGLPLKDAEVFA